MFSFGVQEAKPGIPAPLQCAQVCLASGRNSILRGCVASLSYRFFVIICIRVPVSPLVINFRVTFLI